MKAQELAQWVIDNRYPKSEKQKLSDSEMYHQIVEQIEKLEAEKKELVEALENANYLIKSIKNDCSDSDLYEYYDICMKIESKNQSLIQNHKR